MQRFFEDQSTWGNLRLTEIPHFAEQHDLLLQPKNREQAKRIDKEADAVNVINVPTVFVGDEAFIETIELEKFKSAVEDTFK